MEQGGDVALLAVGSMVQKRLKSATCWKSAAFTRHW